MIPFGSRCGTDAWNEGFVVIMNSQDTSMSIYSSYCFLCPRLTLGKEHCRACFLNPPKPHSSNRRNHFNTTVLTPTILSFNSRLYPMTYSQKLSDGRTCTLYHWVADFAPLILDVRAAPLHVSYLPPSLPPTTSK